MTLQDMDKHWGLSIIQAKWQEHHYTWGHCFPFVCTECKVYAAQSQTWKYNRAKETRWWAAKRRGDGCLAQLCIKGVVCLTYTADHIQHTHFSMRAHRTSPISFSFQPPIHRQQSVTPLPVYSHRASLSLKSQAHACLCLSVHQGNKAQYGFF